MTITDKLKIHDRPAMERPRLVIGLSGWMDGGDVSTGTVGWLIESLAARKFAEIAPEGFYIYHLPGLMEAGSLSRPHTKIREGEIISYNPPSNSFYYSNEKNLILFLGREPHLNWEDYADCIFSLCAEFNVELIYFIGSVAGLVPHTREPRLFCTVSNVGLKDTFKHYGVNFTNYEGPASISTLLSTRCNERGLNMISLVATIPAYVQGRNHKCIETVTRRLSGMLELDLELTELQIISEDFEKKLNEAILQQPELANNISKLEEDYDNEIFNHEMGALKQWLEQQGIRVD
jgi:proteasome assembly chaperone (PAC2) family protein